MKNKKKSKHGRRTRVTLTVYKDEMKNEISYRLDYDTLFGAAKHVVWDRDTFFACVDFYNKIQFSGVGIASASDLKETVPKEIIETASIARLLTKQESSGIGVAALILWRGLHEFLWYDHLSITNKKCTSNRIFARDFLPSSKRRRWAVLSVGYRKKFAEDKNRIDHMAAHLVYDRIEREKRNDHGWSFVELKHSITNGFSQFLSLLEDDRTRWFDSQVPEKPFLIADCRDWPE